MNSEVLSIMHIVVIVPLFLYVGFKRANTPQWLYTGLLAIGSIILLYHGYRLIVRLKSNSSYAWVNAFHIILVAPLLLYIGYHGKETPRSSYELLLMLGFAAAGYHLFSLVKQIDM